MLNDTPSQTDGSELYQDSFFDLYEPKKVLTDGECRIPRTTQLLWMTPHFATQALARNQQNRSISKTSVETLVRVMKAGLFMDTGDCIAFDWYGHLIDGQHRLLACVEANAMVPMTVVWGLNPDVQMVKDTNRPRTAADALTISGIKYGNVMAAAARLILSEKHGNPYEKWQNQEVVDCVNRHKLLGQSVRYLAVHKTPRGISPAQVAFVHYIGSVLLNKPERADAFVNVLATGVPDYPGDPAHVLRERTIKRGVSARKEKMKVEEAFKGVRHAWNMFAVRRGTKQLKWYGDVNIIGLKKESL